MKKYDILGVKTYSDPSYILPGESGPPILHDLRGSTEQEPGFCQVSNKTKMSRFLLGSFTEVTEWKCTYIHTFHSKREIFLLLYLGYNIWPFVFSHLAVFTLTVEEEEEEVYLCNSL